MKAGRSVGIETITPYTWAFRPEPLAGTEGLAFDAIEAAVAPDTLDGFYEASGRLAWVPPKIVRAAVAALFGGEDGLGALERRLADVEEPADQLDIIARLAPEQIAGLFELGARKVANVYGLDEPEVWPC